jgi:hypothetical protein
MKIKECRNCRGTKLELVLDLGQHPPSNSFLDPARLPREEKRYPLELVICRDCLLAQLSCTVDPSEMFTDYVYVSSTSRSLRDHLTQLAASLYAFGKPRPGDLVVDIGSNDGTLLKGYLGKPVRILGIEPSSVGEIAQKSGIETHRAFFNLQTAQEVVRKYGKARIVSATNVFAHIPCQDDFLAGLQDLLEEDGMFVIEVPYLVDMLEQNLFDTIYHEHIFYFSVLALDHLLQSRGFRIFRVERYSFGPSGPPIRVFIGKKSASFEASPDVERLKSLERRLGLENPAVYLAFAGRVWQLKERLLQRMGELKRQGEKLIGYGAPAKGNTILNAFGLDRDWLDLILEKNTLKIGLLTPGTRIPVVDEDAFEMRNYRYALLLSWNLVNEFLEKSDFIRKGGKFILPLPEPKIVPSSS